MKTDAQNRNEEITDFTQKELKDELLQKASVSKYTYLFAEMEFELYMLCKIAQEKARDLNAYAEELGLPQSSKKEVVLRSYTGSITHLD